MTPDTPILMITLQIPVLEDTNVDEVMDAIGQKVGEMLNEIKQQQFRGESEMASEEEARNRITSESQEAITTATEKDLLASLGYAHRAW